MSGEVAVAMRARAAGEPVLETTSGDEYALSVELSVSRDGAQVVRDVQFDLPPGDALGIVGRNGAGKTTLIHGVFGMLPTEGTVRCLGDDVSRLPTYRRASRGMALVPQGRRLFPGLTVAENLRAAKVSPGTDGPEVDPFELFPGLTSLLQRRAGVLSGGQQQQVAIARALLRRPHVIFLDEPTEGLAPSLIGEVVEALRRLRESGLTIVLAEQHLHVIEGICTQILPLRAGDVTSRARATSEFSGSEAGSLVGQPTTDQS